MLALLLFVLRYSMISAIQGHYSLAHYRSSVERSQASNELLDQHGSAGLVYTLRGFLFFGTANAILDTMQQIGGDRPGRPARNASRRCRGHLPFLNQHFAFTHVVRRADDALIFR